ncbi:VanZ family protein [Pontibacillus yanchengensis]|uniref:VanZ family protein n=1 Tax=Pontibacillus yanchengensis TaxID=462910 RepID=A0ACC7VJ59_9BACI|nr:VanZ family protein [Pontibacillus yanchengensis]MYL53979.1 VanZ family protein [Pontibacillus yanchengensis]
MKKIGCWLLPLTWMGVLFYSSSTPYKEQNIKPFMKTNLDLSFLEPYLQWVSFTYHHTQVSISNLGIEGLIEFFIRKGAHLFSFFLLCLLIYIAIQQTTKMKHATQLILSFCLAISYGAIDEIHQHFTSNRTPYVGDVIVDGFGALLAVGLLFLFFFVRSTKKQSE